MRSFATLRMTVYLLGTSTVATACAAMPSRRPVKPSPSVVVAFTLTLSTLDAGDARDACRPWPRDAGRCAAPRRPVSGRDGRCARRARPRDRRRGAGSGRRTTPRHCGSEGGKCLPMSPAPIVPSSASVSACSATSASEWPARAWLCGMATPPSITWLPSAEAVHVEAEGGARLHRRDHVAPAVVILRLSSCPSTMTTRRPARSATAASSVRAVASCVAQRRRRAMRGEQLGEAEDLRRLRPPQAGARHGPGQQRRHRRPASACRRAARPAPRRRCRDATASRQPMMSDTPNEGAGGIVDGDQVGGMRRQRLQAVQDRLLPAGAAGDRRRQVHPLDGSPIEVLVAGGDHDLDAVDARCRPEAHPGCGAGRVGPPEWHIAWAGGRRSGCPGRRRRSGRCKLARPAR